MTPRHKTRAKKRIVLGFGSFGFRDFGQAIELWNTKNSHRKTFNMKRIRDLDGVSVRLVAEVLLRRRGGR